MSLVLSLETSTDVCSVALHEKHVLLKHISIDEPQAHASKLAPLISELLVAAAVKPSSLKAVSVSTGPGSYTGLRIGASTAKGLCYALGIPLIAIPTLSVLAFQGRKHAAPGELLCPMIDARRMEVYCQVFNPQMTPESDVEAKIIDEFSFAELLAGSKMLFFGNGASKCREVITSSSARFVEGLKPAAMDLGALAAEKFQRSEFEDLTSFKPFYLKEFVAKKAHPLL
jgi:tRNA threonylcarbamoyladenosine biosynthesis protein TsaB